MVVPKLDMQLPVEVIFNPSWWSKNCGITFNKDFFFEPSHRVHVEMKMRKYLYERYGELGLGEKNPVERPVIGPVHLAAGYIIPEMLGCDVRFNENASPDVMPANMTDMEIMKLKVPEIGSSRLTRDLVKMMNQLEEKYGFLEGDVDWVGVQNAALDLRGQQLFIDYFENPHIVRHLFDVVSKTIAGFTAYMKRRTGTTSISVNPSVRHFKPQVNLHSNCSITMISNATYEKYLLEYDNYLSERLQPYGIHHCGNNMERVAEGYSKVKDVCFFDVGWGSDVKQCRKHLPDAFFNLRLSPVKILDCPAEEIEKDIKKLVDDNGGIDNAGLCCINMDYGTPDENIRKIYETADLFLREELKLTD